MYELALSVVILKSCDDDDFHLLLTNIWIIELHLGDVAV